MRRQGASWNPTALFVLAAIAMFALSACGGGSYLQVNLLRDATHDKPVYVGVYYLSQEAAIDGASIPDLIDNPDQFSDGVVDKRVLPVYPGEVKPITMENYAPDIKWIAVVADFGSSAECTRDKKPVPPGSKFALNVKVEADCIELEIQ
ncbi:MAG: type VI secretion lipoprotein TssJ [Candidatus Eisenbacteria bacterium]